MTSEGEWPLTDTKAVRLARLCLANAREYAAQAELLAERQWYGRAVAMAILGLEETAKAWYLLLATASLFPRSISAFRAVCGKHRSKQAISVLLDVAVGMVDKIPPPADISDGSATFAAGAWPALPADFQMLIAKAGESFSAAVEADLGVSAQAIEAASAGLSAVKRNELDRLKQRGLYVDYSTVTESVSTPSDITMEECETWIDKLSVLLGASVGLMDNSLGDEDLARMTAQLKEIASHPAMPALIERGRQFRDSQMD